MNSSGFFETIIVLYLTFSVAFFLHWAWNIHHARKARQHALCLLSSLSLDQDITGHDPRSLKKHLDTLLEKDGLEKYAIALSAAYFLRESNDIPSSVFEQEVNSLAANKFDYISRDQVRIFSPQNLRAFITQDQCTDYDMRYLAGRLVLNLRKVLGRKRLETV
jgi:hypothetical protein